MNEHVVAYLRKIAARSKEEYLAVYLPLVEADVPLQFIEFDYSNLTGTQIQPAVTKVKEYIQVVHDKGLFASHGKGFYLYGSHGSGKTALACVMLKNLLRAGYSRRERYSCGFVLYDDLIVKLRENEFEGEEYDFLVIDGFREEATHDWVNHKFMAVIRNRYHKLRPTIITAVQDMAKSTKDSVKSPLLEMATMVNTGRTDSRKEGVQ